MAPPRRQLAERRQHESSLVIAGVGNGQRPRPNAPPSEGKKVQINGARAPADPALAAQLTLDLEKALEKPVRLALHPESGDAVVKRSLRRTADGVRGIEMGDLFNADSVDAVESAQRAAQQREARAEVGAEGHESRGGGGGGVHFRRGIIPARGASVVSTETGKFSDGNKFIFP